MLEDEITPWSNAEFNTLEMARQSKLLSQGNIKSLKNILKKQPMQNLPVNNQHLLVKKPQLNNATMSLTPNKPLGAADQPPLLRGNNKSIELSKERLIRRKHHRQSELHHEPSFSKLDSSVIESQMLERRPVRFQRASRIVMPQIISKSPKQIRNPEAWKDLTDENIFKPMRRLGRQKRQDSLILPKVKIALGSGVYRTIETN